MQRKNRFEEFGTVSSNDVEDVSLCFNNKELSFSQYH